MSLESICNFEDIINKAWALYYSPEKEEVADYTKYDALYDVTCDMDILDEEYEELMEEMSCQ